MDRQLLWLEERFLVTLGMTKGCSEWQGECHAECSEASFWGIPRCTRNDKGMLGMTRGCLEWQSECHAERSEAFILRDSSRCSVWQGDARNDKGNVMQNEAQRSEASHWSALRTEAGYRVPPKAWPRFRRGNAQKGPIKKASRNSRGFAFIENEAITFYRPFCLSVLEA